MTVPPSLDRLTLPHLEVLGKVGYKIQLLTIDNMESAQQVCYTVLSKNEYLYNMGYGHWTNHALQFCPNLKKLTINRPVFIELDHTKEKEAEEYPSLKTLNILEIEIRMAKSILKRLSKSFPSLKQM